MDLLAEIAVPPRFRPGAEALLPPALRAEVDAYLAARQPAGFLAALRQRLLLPAHEVHLCGTKYNVPLLNALVFYVGVQVRAAPAGPARQPLDTVLGAAGWQVARHVPPWLRPGSGRAGLAQRAGGSRDLGRRPLVAALMMAARERCERLCSCHVVELALASVLAGCRQEDRGRLRCPSRADG